MEMLSTVERGADAMSIDTYEIGPTNYDILLPDPETAPVHYTLISVDDHLVEPPDMFDGRLPAALQSKAPRQIGRAHV